jgi:hypothetical protein
MTPDNKEDPNGKNEHWIVTLYERYAKLYGDPIEQPLTPKNNGEQQPDA